MQVYFKNTGLFKKKTVKNMCSSQNIHYRLKEMHNHNFNNVY